MSDSGRGHDRHHALASGGDRRVFWAVAVNLLLTVAQIAGGVAAGSLALIADAIHNLSDAVALGIAYVARRIARRPADDAMTFGYGRAEIVAALVNYTVLMVIGAYLIYEAIWRLIEPQSVHGWIVVIVAGVALAVDTVTAILTYRLAEHSINIRAAFLHNLADAFGSIGVIVAGTLIILFNLTIVDAIITLAIAGYILWLVGSEIGAAIRILMLATPRDVSPERVLAELCRLPGIADVHHLHIWQFNEHENSLEAHLVIATDARLSPSEIKHSAKSLIASRFAIKHSTLEIETVDENCPDIVAVGHA